MGYAWLANAMNEGSDGLYERMAALPPGALPEIERSAPPVPPAPPPPPPRNAPPPPPDFLVTLREFLKPEIDQGLLSVFGDARSVTVRIKGARHVRLRLGHRRAALHPDACSASARGCAPSRAACR